MFRNSVSMKSRAIVMTTAVMLTDIALMYLARRSWRILSLKVHFLFRRKLPVEPRKNAMIDERM